MPVGKKLLIVCNDAGGSEVVSSWVKRYINLYEFDFYLEGPAREIFRKKLGEIENIKMFCDGSLIRKYDFILTGTSWTSDLEKKFIYIANKFKVPAAAYLDHWMDYLERFTLDGQVILPQQIWVGDIYADKIAKSIFKKSYIRLVPNIYLREIGEKIRASVDTEASCYRKRILYVAEPTSVVGRFKYGNENYYGYTEFEALEEYLNYILDIKEKSLCIRVRLHPTESEDKYLGIVSKYNSIVKIEQTNNKSLIEDCAWANTVVGCQSMALVVGLYAQREVYSCIPKRGAPLIIPFTGIKKLFQD
jgi:hypothetical protein